MDDECEAELDSLVGLAIAAMGYDDGEWFFLFSNGMRMVLSAGDDPEYYISGSLN